MSTIHRAKRCTVSDLTVTPEKWDSYPVLDRSTIRSSHFKDLSSSTCIKRSSLDRVTVQSDGKSSYLKHSSLTDSLINDSNMKFGKISGSSFIAVAQAKWLRTRNSSFTHIKKIKQIKCEDSSIRNTTALKLSSLKRSVITDSNVIKRSVLEDVGMRASSVQRSELKNCDITDCDISGTNFSGMTLKYGVWKNGELVGRTGGREVVIVSRAADIPPQEKGSTTKECEPPKLQTALMDATRDPMDGGKGTSHEIDAQSTDSSVADSAPDDPSDDSRELYPNVPPPPYKA
ncbi:hypothetical protein Egran_06951 [Elaphomyces granulatus]|uniref:Uncharacterized protein n=1 Tax=Elaphomyces granulatus TaxID=519963 RepID=A0A232LMA4_9EURO|nr:hypothetical protein Egran_06951 [Elaphomyces granulatus]